MLAPLEETFDQLPELDDSVSHCRLIGSKGDSRVDIDNASRRLCCTTGAMQGR
jgi:hypothetical protein